MLQIELDSTKARQEASRDLNLTPLENRCLSNLGLIGNVSLGLVKSLPEAINYDTAPTAKSKLHRQWENVLERMRLLEKTSTALFVQVCCQVQFATFFSPDLLTDPASWGLISHSSYRFHS